MDDVRKAFESQLSIGWKLLEYHLADLTQEECLWQPASKGLHVVEESGTWRADWPKTESYSIGPPSIAWLTWHIGFWWSMALNHSFGDGTLRRESVVWPGTVEETREWLLRLHAEWVEALSGLSEDDLMSASRTLWPFSGKPFVDLMAWLNIELMKNAAEIGYCRFLYAAR